MPTAKSGRTGEPTGEHEAWGIAVIIFIIVIAVLSLIGG